MRLIDADEFANTLQEISNSDWFRPEYREPFRVIIDLLTGIDKEKYAPTAGSDIKESIRNATIDEVIAFIQDHSGDHYIDCDGYFGGEPSRIFNLDNWLLDLGELKDIDTE